MANPATTFRLLKSGTNSKGDLFTRLMKDLFYALGYDALRINVHKAGREIDIEGRHRLEDRVLVAECKAEAQPIGGAEVNKFVGALQRERRKHSSSVVVGYFVSLSGFTETAIEQERDAAIDGLVLLNGEKIVEELQLNRLLLSRLEAMERAGRCAQHAALSATVGDAELIACELGYIWAVHYLIGKARSHFALIHADGTPLAEKAAAKVISADAEISGELSELQYLPGPPQPPDHAELFEQAMSKYRDWIASECGYIQLDGLPADSDLSATRLKLERLFVPLRVMEISSKKESPVHVNIEDVDWSADQEYDTVDEMENEQEAKETVRVLTDSVYIGSALQRHRHLAVLASPGGGKSTLLKRIATAYAFPERRHEAQDGLPDQPWLPLFIRCRDLRDHAHKPISELLNDIGVRAGMTHGELKAFQERLHQALAEGETVLLIDGLDELSDEGARKAFAHNLRTFLAVFPKQSLVLTSREAGFRIVGGVIASSCHIFRLAPFDKYDVRRLCVAWHAEVVGATDKVKVSARELAATIWSNLRIRGLAENPLLLTTLLVVKRWTGELPPSRATLYREAVRVLIRTWNVEGYAPLHEDETLAQLSYVACAMTSRGVQRIGYKRLLELLTNARTELEAELQFTKISPSEFIERIEYRSSLLMQTGHEVIDAELQPIYEFRHLTFQEYLTSRGYIEGQFPNRDHITELADLLEPHFTDPVWREVVSLAMVLAGRRAEETIRRLNTLCSHLDASAVDDNERPFPAVLLRQCLLDEVQVTASTLRESLRQIARFTPASEAGPWWLKAVSRSKFGALLQQVVEDTYLNEKDGWEEMYVALADLSVASMFNNGVVTSADGLGKVLIEHLQSSSRASRTAGAFVIMQMAYRSTTLAAEGETSPELDFEMLRQALYPLLDGNDKPICLACAWALAWIVEKLVESPPSAENLLKLFHIWKNTYPGETSRMAAWALSGEPLLARDSIAIDAWGDCDEFLTMAMKHRRPLAHREAALVVNWYRRRPLDDARLSEIVASYKEREYIPKLAHLQAAFERRGTLFEKADDRGQDK